MDTFPVRLKSAGSTPWEGNPVAIVFRVDKDYYKGPARVGYRMHLLEKDEKADRLFVWVNDGWMYATSRDIL